MAAAELTPLQQALLQRLDSVATQVKSAATAQLPDLAQQLIVMGRVRETLVMLCSVGLLALAGWLLWYARTRADRYTRAHHKWAAQRPREWDTEPTSPEGRCFAAGCGVAACVFFGIILASVNFTDFCAAWLAPKIYVLHQLKELL